MIFRTSQDCVGRLLMVVSSFSALGDGISSPSASRDGACEFGPRGAGADPLRRRRHGGRRQAEAAVRHKASSSVQFSSVQFRTRAPI